MSRPEVVERCIFGSVPAPLPLHDPLYILQVASQLDAADKSAIESKISETIAWLDTNQNAEKEEYEEKQKELEAVCTPIIQKMAAAGGAGGMPGGMPDMNGAGFPGAGAPTPEADADAGPKIERIEKLLT